MDCTILCTDDITKERRCIGSVEVTTIEGLVQKWWESRFPKKKWFLSSILYNTPIPYSKIVTTRGAKKDLASTHTQKKGNKNFYSLHFGKIQQYIAIDQMATPFIGNDSNKMFILFYFILFYFLFFVFFLIYSIDYYFCFPNKWKLSMPFLMFSIPFR